MFKKVIKSLSTTDSIMSLIINLMQIPTIIIGAIFDKMIIISIATLTLIIGILLFLRIAKKTAKKIEKDNMITQLNIEKQNEELQLKIEHENELMKIKNDIVNKLRDPKLHNKYKNSVFFSPFEEKAMKKEFFLIELSNMFDNITCKELKSIIDSNI